MHDATKNPDDHLQENTTPSAHSPSSDPCGASTSAAQAPPLPSTNWTFPRIGPRALHLALATKFGSEILPLIQGPRLDPVDDSPHSCAGYPDKASLLACVLEPGVQRMRCDLMHHAAERPCRNLPGR
jgi:hypothetical protein